jgi:predicted MFS family arabinose efflux permease
VAGVRAAIAGLRGDGRGWILATIGAGWFLAIGVRLVFPALLPAVREAFDFDLTTAGLLLSLLWFAYALGQFPGGVLGDRIGDRNVLVLSTLLATGTILALTLAGDLVAFFVATVLFGLGTGLFTTTRFTVLSNVYPERDATAMGLTASAGSLGSTVLPVIAGGPAAAVGWRAGFGFVLPLYPLTVVGLWWAIPEYTGDPDSAVDRLTPANARRIGAAIGRRPVALATVSMLLMSALYQGFTGFYPTYLVSVAGFDGRFAATLFGLFFGAGILIQPVAGGVADWFGARRTLLVTTASSVGAVAAIPFVASAAGFVGLTLVLSVQLGFWPVVQSYTVRLLPADVQGSSFGLLRTLYLIGASAGPTVVGVIADAGRFDAAFFVLAAWGAVATALVVALPRGGR